MKSGKIIEKNTNSPLGGAGTVVSRMIVEGTLGRNQQAEPRRGAIIPVAVEDQDDHPSRSRGGPLNTAPAPHNSEFLFFFFMVFQIFLERLQTSKATIFWRLRSTTFCQNVVPMGATF